MISGQLRTHWYMFLDGMTGPARVLLYTGITMLVYTALLADTALDPYIQESAFPALLGEESVLWERTLADGHWLIWFWSARGVLDWPPGLFFLFVLLWTIASAIMAQAIFADDRLPWRGMAATLAFAAAPPVADLALTYPELVPLTALLAAYAAICTLARLLWAQALLLVAIPLGMLCHPAAGLAFFAILMVTPRHSGDGTSLMRGLLIYVAASGLGMFVMLLLNKAAHDVFDVLRPVADRPNPATDLATAMENVDLLQVAAVELGEKVFGPVPIVALWIFAFAMIAIYRLEPQRGDRIFGGVSVAVVIMALDVVRTGRIPGVGEMLGLWIFFIAALAWAAHFLSQRRMARVVILAVLVCAGVGLAEWQRSQSSGNAYQLASKALADDIAAEIASAGTSALSRRGTEPPVPNGPRGRAHTLGMPPVRRVLLAGSPASVEGAEVLKSFDALATRLSKLLEMPVIQCPAPKDICADKLSTIVTMPAHPEPGYVSLRPMGDVLVRLRDGVFVEPVLP